MVKEEETRLNMVPKLRHTNIPAAYLILKKENQILLLKRYQTGYQDGNFSLIAGHLEPGESFQQAIIREAREEAGIELETNNILQTHIQHRKSVEDGSERVDAYFLVESWQGEIQNMEPEKCSALEWFEMNHLPRNIIPCVQTALELLFQGESYSEFGWNNKH